VFSVIEVAGFQYSVAEGDTINVPLLPQEQGAEITVDKVLLLNDGKETKVGFPTISGATVSAKVVKHGKGSKVIVYKKKRRKDYKRTQGHRQGYSQIQITSIKG